MSNLKMSNPEPTNTPMNSSNSDASDSTAPNLETTDSVPSKESNESVPSEPIESFKDIFSEYEQSHSRKSESGSQRREGTVVSLTADSVILDIGFKTEGILLRTAFENNAEAVAPGDKFTVTPKGRNLEGYYELSRIHIAQPKDWSALEAAFADQTPVVGTVTAVVKGGLSVDIGVRAFMPASRSGVRDAAEIEKLVGQEITCRIIKLDAADEDVVVDRRVIAEEQARTLEQSRYGELKEGDLVSEGQVLVIIESMKMEMPVEAPRAGTVEKVHVAEAQAVSEGDTLVTLG